MYIFLLYCIFFHSVVSFPMFYPNFTPVISFYLLYLFLSCCILLLVVSLPPSPLYFFLPTVFLHYYCIICLPVSFPFLLYQLSLVGCIIPFLYFSHIMEPSYLNDLLFYPSFWIRLLFFFIICPPFSLGTSFFIRTYPYLSCLPELQGYPQMLKLFRRLYGIYTGCFLHDSLQLLLFFLSLSLSNHYIFHAW